MSTPLRFLDGLSNVAAADPLGSMPYLDPTKWIIYHEDFCSGFLGGNTVANGNATANGIYCVASANATVNIVTDAGGILGCLKIVTTAADNEYGWLQTLSPGFTMTAGKKFIMETSFEVTHTAGNIDENEIFIGLASYSASLTAAFAAGGTTLDADDGIGLYSGDNDTNINFVVGEDDTYDTKVVITTYLTATWYRVSIYYDGTNIYLWVNDTTVGHMTPDQIPVSVIGPMFFLRSGEAKVHQLLVDYLFCAFER
jgi:hypothetical protein